MVEGEDSTDNIELQKQPSSDKDRPKEREHAPNSVADTSDKPPTPPKRDYGAETSAPMGKTSDSSEKKHSGFFPKAEVIYSPDKSSSSMTCLKNCLIIFSLLIWLFGAALTGLGLWAKLDGEFKDIQSGLNVTQFTPAAHILLIAGLVIMVVGFTGCYGAMTQKIWVLIIFSVFIVIVILMECAVMGLVWSAVSNQNMQEEIKSRAKNILQKVGENEALQRLMDLMQSKLHCCGVDSSEDYSSDPNNPIPIPRSCRDLKTGDPYELGCAKAIVDYFKSKAAILGGIALAVLILQLAVLVFTVCVICGIKHAATSSIF